MVGEEKKVNTGLMKLLKGSKGGQEDPAGPEPAAPTAPAARTSEAMQSDPRSKRMSVAAGGEKKKSIAIEASKLRKLSMWNKVKLTVQLGAGLKSDLRDAV